MATRITITAAGEAQLRSAFAKRVRDGLAQYGPGIAAIELEPRSGHFELDSADGVPFPLLVAASERYVGLDILVEWSGERGAGTVVLKGGKIARQTLDPASGASPPSP